MVELLKQPQFVPMDVIDQVIQIYAGSIGVLDNLKIDQVQPFSTALIEHYAGPGKAVRDKLASAKALDDELKADIKQSTADFKAGWVAANPSA